MGNRRELVTVYWRRLRAQSIRATAQKVADPTVAKRHLTRLIQGEPAHDRATNPYLPSFSRDEERDFVSTLTGASHDDVEALFAEIEQNTRLQELADRYEVVRGVPASSFDLGRFRVWYAFVRLAQPDVVVETGVHDGMSSTILLLALDRNAAGGRLISIDLPSTDLPTGVTGPGWLVPDDLRRSWDLRLGDAKKLLPEALAEVGKVGIFIHDSDHSEEHQRFEYTAALPHMVPGGLLLSDQDYPIEVTLTEVAERVGGKHARCRSAVPASGIPTYIGGVALP